MPQLMPLFWVFSFLMVLFILLSVIYIYEFRNKIVSIYIGMSLSQSSMKWWW